MKHTQIHPRDKWVIGLFAWMTLLCLLIYIYHVVSIYHGGVPDSYYYDNTGDFVSIDSEVFLMMLIFFVTYITVGIASLIMMKFFIINHIATKSNDPKGLKIFWVICTLLCGTLTAPIYYHVVIAKSPRLWEEKSPLFEFE